MEKMERRKREPMPDVGASDRDVAEFWETHSVADYWDDLEPAEFSDRHAPRQVVTLRLDPKAVEALRAVAHRRGLDYSSMTRGWIVERLREELTATAKPSRKKHRGAA